MCKQVSVFGLVLFSVFGLLFGSSSSLSAADINSVTFKGHVSRVDIVTLNGSYLETLLYSWSYDPSAPLQATAFRCNGNAGGDLSNCLYPSAFLGCPMTTTTVQDNYQPNQVTYQYECSTNYRRDAGACVTLGAQIRPLDPNFYSYLNQTQSGQGYSEVIQAIAFDTKSIAFTTGCNPKTESRR